MRFSDRRAWRRALSLSIAMACVVAVVACSSSNEAKTPTPADPAAGISSIEHIVVLTQENRSFDHYFGHLKAYAPQLDLEQEPADASNPDPTNPGGPPITAFHQTNLCEVADL